MDPLDSDITQESSPTMSYRTASNLTSPLQFTRDLSRPVTDISYGLADIAENRTNGSAASANPEAIGARTPNTAAIAFSYIDDFNYMDFDFYPLWLFPTLPSVAPPAGDDLQAVLTATPTQTIAAQHSDLVSNNLVALTAPSQTKMIYPIKPDHTSNGLQVYPTADDGGTERHITTAKYAVDYLYSNTRVVTPSMVPSPGGVWVSAPDTASATDMFEFRQMVLGKRRRGTDDGLDNQGLGTGDGHGLCPHKEEKTEMTTTIGVLGAEGTPNMTRRNTAVEASTSVHTTSEADEYRADMLMVLNAQGSYGRPLQRPSVQQESTETAVREETTSVEEAVQEATWRQTDSMVEQEEEEEFNVDKGKLEVMKDNLFRIPKQPDEKYKRFLEATSEDFTRGTPEALKCKLCPTAGFRSWDDFVRHCKTTNSHPLKLFFCDNCGDFFARYDSLKRHCKNRPSRCSGTSPHEAEEKQRETEKIHEQFMKILDAYLKTNEGTWTAFTQVIKEKYVGSSKRGRRKQSRVGAYESMSC